MDLKSLANKLAPVSVFADLKGFFRDHALMRVSPGAKGEEWLDLDDPESKSRQIVDVNPAFARLDAP
jgi:hypothetical protein